MKKIENIIGVVAVIPIVFLILLYFKLEHFSAWFSVINGWLILCGIFIFIKKIQQIDARERNDKE